jgi:hypothetical protein
VRDYYDALHPYSKEDGYINFISAALDRSGPGSAQLRYGTNYQWLTEIKTIYDPDNLFSLNQNISPAGWFLLTGCRLRVTLRHSKPRPECRLLGVKQTKSARKPTSAGECRMLGVDRT